MADSEGKSSYSSKSEGKSKKKKKKAPTPEKTNSIQNKKRIKKKSKAKRAVANSTDIVVQYKIKTPADIILPDNDTDFNQNNEGDKCDISLRWDYLNSSTEADTAERLKWYKMHRRMRYEVAAEERKSRQFGIMNIENMTISKPPPHIIANNNV